MNAQNKIMIVVITGVLLVTGAIIVEKRAGLPSRSVGSTAPVASKEARGTSSPAPSSRTLSAKGASASQMSARAWTAKFRASSDYLRFIHDALPAAQQGDARASWYIGEALSACALVMKTYRGIADPEAQLNQELANMPNAPQWTRDLLEQKTRRCLGLANEDPFAALPHRDVGYPATYWRQQALDLGDPLAQVQAATDVIAKVLVMQSMSPAEKSNELNGADSHLRAAVESGDPDALYNVGLLLSDGRYSSDPLNGVAVALAACDLGRDCSSANPENAFANCSVSGACPATADYAYFLQQSLGADKYALVYAHAQEIEQAVRSGDWQTVLTTLKLGTT